MFCAFVCTTAPAKSRGLIVLGGFQVFGRGRPVRVAAAGMAAATGATKSERKTLAGVSVAIVAAMDEATEVAGAGVASWDSEVGPWPWRGRGGSRLGRGGYVQGAERGLGEGADRAVRKVEGGKRWKRSRR